jgi:dTDP-glucose pyrophosphorylase
VKDWKKVVVPEEATLIEAIACIDASALQIALVVGRDGKLAGVLTDGDVRRGLLRGLGLGSPATEAMNPSPRTALASTPREQLVSVMRRNGIRHIPLIDAEGRAVGLATLDDLTGLSKRDNRVVIMAGGLGSRLSPLTDNCPKPMLDIGGKPLLQTTLEHFIDHGFYRFSIAVNYMADVIKAYFGEGSHWNVDISYLEEKDRLGTAGALSLLPTRPEEPMLVMNGDVLTNANFNKLLDFHVQQQAVATICVREYEVKVPYGVVTTGSEGIASIDEKPVQCYNVNAGIYVIQPEMLSRIPADQFFDMPTLFSEAVSDGLKTAVFPIREYWLDIGHIVDYHRANGEYREIFS